MEKWLKICLLLCVVGFLKEFRPNESFGVEYLVGPWQNETIEEVMQLVFPVWTYSYFALLVVTFLITDFLLYKPIVVCEGLGFTIFYIIIIWAYGIPWMQFSEVFYAIGTACDVAYNTYIYAQVPQDKFQVVTGYTLAAALMGGGLGHVCGQVLISTEVCDYSTINYISLAFVSAATIIACFLPSASQSVYFHRVHHQSVPATTNTPENDRKDHPALPLKKSPWRLLWTDFYSSYSNTYTLKWSIWWSFATCGQLLVFCYIQSLWEAVNAEGTSKTWNGAVEATNTLLSALAALAIGYVRVDWSVYGEPIIAIISLFEASMLLMASTTKYLWGVYIGYIFFTVTYRILITIASAEVAKGLKQESYGLVFGINTFLALLIQTIMTLIVVERSGFALGPQQQFMVYGSYFVLLGAFFLVMSIYKTISNRMRRVVT